MVQHMFHIHNILFRTKTNTEADVPCRPQFPLNCTCFRRTYTSMFSSFIFLHNVVLLMPRCCAALVFEYRNTSKVSRIIFSSSLLNFSCQVLAGELTRFSPSHRILEYSIRPEYSFSKTDFENLPLHSMTSFSIKLRNCLIFPGQLKDFNFSNEDSGISMN